MKIYILIIKFLFIGALFIVSDNHLVLTDSHQRDTFLTLYVDWLSGLYGKSVGLTAYVVNSEWLPVQHLANSTDGAYAKRGFWGQKLER